MKQFLLLLCLFLLTATTAFAQQSTRQLPTNHALRQAPPASPLSVTVPSLGQYEKSVVADTLFPASFDLTCSNSARLYFSDTTGTMGFLSGTNQFFDVEKLQRVTLEESTDLSVNQVLVAFAVADTALNDRKIAVNIYPELDADGNFGALAGTSDTLLVRDLLLSDSFIRFTTFNFSTPAELTDAGSFLIGVNFFELYFDERDSIDRAGDVAIFSTEIGCGDGENTLEIFPGANGLSFNTIQANWGVDLEFFIGAIVERDPFTATRTPNADFSASAFPNPADDQLTVNFAAPVAGKYTARLVAPNGQEVRSTVLSANRGNMVVKFAVADLPAGVYLFQVQHTTGVQTGRVVIK